MDQEAFIDALVRGTYRAFLRREGEPEGVENWKGWLRGNFNPTRVTDFLGNMAASEELQRRMNDDTLGKLRQHMANGPSGEGAPFAFLMSAGPACYISIMLNHWRMRRFAGPFDGIFSSLRMVEHVLRDDFALFLSPSHMVDAEIGGGDLRTKHSFYAELADYLHGVALPTFLHHDPRTEKDRLHFERAAERVRIVLSGREGRALLLNVSQAHDRLLADFVSLAGYLSERAPEAALVLFIVEPPSGAALPDIEVVQRIGEHTAYRMRPLSHLVPEGFQNMLDEIAVMQMLHHGRRFDLKRL